MDRRRLPLVAPIFAAAVAVVHCGGDDGYALPDAGVRARSSDASSSDATLDAPTTGRPDARAPRADAAYWDAPLVGANRCVGVCSTTADEQCYAQCSAQALGCQCNDKGSFQCLCLPL